MTASPLNGCSVTALDPEAALRLYPVAKVAELLGTGTRFVYSEIAAKRLPTVELGRGDRSKFRIRATDLEAYITAQATGTAARSSKRT